MTNYLYTNNNNYTQERKKVRKKFNPTEKHGRNTKRRNLFSFPQTKDRRNAKKKGGPHRKRKQKKGKRKKMARIFREKEEFLAISYVKKVNK